MALTGLEIYKLLPKTNCKECGFPTCLAFAMKLAQKGTELTKCPYVTDETRAALDAASAPPIRLVAVGGGERVFEVGNETVLVRHEKTFYHQPGLVVRLNDDDPGLAAAAESITGYAVERVGVPLGLDGIALQNVSGDVETYRKAVETVRAVTDLPLVLVTDDPEAMGAALAVTGTTRPLLCGATVDTWQAMAELAVGHKCPLTVRCDGDLTGLAELTEALGKAGVEDLMLDPGVRGLADSLVLFTQLRRLALKKNLRTLGFPIIAFVGAQTVEEEALLAAEAIAKYAGVVVLDHADPALYYTLLALRQNIYTDPQKPIQVEPGLYPIGAPGADSPLLITTNFSLTYFSVSGEVEGAGQPAWLLVADADGQSVLTSWAAGKFDAEKRAKTVKESGVADKLAHKKLVIPGHVASLSGETEEELPGWQIMVGPREAVDLPSYLKTVWSQA
jgi:acetyl-CoA decarbonylase/synthase complex subunit gamma